ncbi:hypothetical protein EVAR_99852_1 [Eumeta japonica]|uniref:Uncharacterized protein n=1 Tax=Eumeta variegata TaxID=151549 RepID=A0A4C1SCS1_EUMVA|nr:hypothetical protein EVAR_99852_1 [Eumeta japonica]
MLWLTWLQQDNGPPRQVRYNTQTEYRCEVAAFVVAFRPVSKSVGASLRNPTPLSSFSIILPSIIPLTSLHSFHHSLYQMSYPKGQQGTGDFFEVASVHGRRWPPAL